MVNLPLYPKVILWYTLYGCCSITWVLPLISIALSNLRRSWRVLNSLRSYLRISINKLEKTLFPEFCLKKHLISYIKQRSEFSLFHIVQQSSIHSKNYWIHSSPFLAVSKTLLLKIIWIPKIKIIKILLYEMNTGNDPMTSNIFYLWQNDGFQQIYFHEIRHEILKKIPRSDCIA